MAQTIAVRFQSRGGNTKAVAQEVARAAGVAAEAVGVPLEGPVDLLFVGGGVYAWDIDRELKAFLETLGPDSVKACAAFTTGGGFDGTQKILDAARAKGIPVRADTLALKMGPRNLAFLGGKGSVTLNDKDLQKINAFVKKAVGNTAAAL
jgi:flavodoxin